MDTSFASRPNNRANGAPLNGNSPAVKPKRGPRHRYAQHKPRLKRLEDMDGRCAGAIRAKELVAGLESDLGGSENISIGRRELVKHAALLGAIVEDFEVAWVQRSPPPMQMSEYLSALGVQRRLLVTLGIERLARPVDDVDRMYAQELARLESEDNA